jgi:hypothetical protein
LSLGKFIRTGARLTYNWLFLLEEPFVQKHLPEPSVIKPERASEKVYYIIVTSVVTLSHIYTQMRRRRERETERETEREIV